MLRLYTFLLYLALPWVLLRVWWRGFSVPGSRRHWRERLGYVAGASGETSPVWLHAVSVGEVRAAAPLIDALLQADPHMSLLVTTTTPTGRETVTRLFGGRVRQAYLPWDLPCAIRRFLVRVRPVKVIVMETELWPNLFHTLKQRGIPLYLVNARLSDTSLRGYRRVPSLVHKTLACVTGIAAQSETDAERFVEIGAAAQQVIQAGNLKYEINLPSDYEHRLEALRQRYSGREPVWIAASTHPGEERMALAAHEQLLERYPESLLLLVPRHPERAAEVAALCQRAGMAGALYSALEGDGTDQLLNTSQVVVVDVLGELAYLYGLAGVALIGGSLVPHGGHNPLEALQADCAVITGGHTGNFADIYCQLEAVTAVTRIKTGELLAETIEGLFNDSALRAQQLAAGRQVLNANRGALAQVKALLETEGCPPV